MNIFSGTITSRKRQSSEVLGSGVGRSERLKEPDEELDSLIKVATGTPDKNFAAINSHAGFAWGHMTVVCPSLTVRFLPCGGTGAANRRLPIGAAPYLMLLKL